MRKPTLMIALLVLLAACGGEGESGESGPPDTSTVSRGGPAMEEIRLVGPDGEEKRPLEAAPEGEIAVLVFLYPDCPIANAFAPEFLRLRQRFRDESVTWHFVHADPELELSAVRDHAADFAFAQSGEGRGPASVWLDREHDAVRATGATVTPEAVVLRGDGERWAMTYRGRVNDLFVDFGQRRAKASTDDLADAVRRALDGPVREAVLTRAIGCYIEVESR